MTRTLRSLFLTFTACAVVAGVLAPPAGGQVDPGELSELEGRRDEIISRLATLDATIAELTTELDALEDAVGAAEVGIELVADDFERTVDARREPASTRVEMALVGFTQGDPTQNGILDEIRTLEGDDGPTRRRVLYESVIEDTTDRLTAIDDRLGSLADELDQAREALSATREIQAATQEELDVAGALRAQLADELQDTINRIEELRELRNRSVLTGLTSFEDPSRPALAVKIDNVPAAWPQAGINQADMVYVELVEGGLTRLAAVFHGQGAEVVGPVRSMRTSDFHLLAQFNSPLFANSGGNRYTQGALRDSTLVDISINAAFDVYYREGGRRAPHNLFTNAYNLWAVRGLLEKTAGSPSPFFRFREAGDPMHPGAQPARRIDVRYGTTSAAYDWNGTSWDRSQDGVPTVDTDGVRASPTTVVVQFTDYGVSPADPASPEAITVGNGPAWIFTDGHYIAARWRRNDLTAQTEYVDSDGNPIPILPGRVWIELPRRNDASRS